MSRFNTQIGERAIPLRPLIGKAFTSLLIACCVFLLINARQPNGQASDVRMFVSDAVLPVVHLLSAPAQSIQAMSDHLDNLVFIYHHNRELRLENERLMQWHHTAQSLALENASLRDLMNYQPENATHYVTAKVVGNMGSNLSHSLLINAGAAQGITMNQAVINEYGLVGRIIEVGNNSSRVLLLSDINSRIPVIIEPDGIKTILMGDRSDLPQLQFVDSKANPQLGSEIVTASDGGVFPAGLPVGKLFSHGDNGWSAKPYVDLKRVGFVRVVDFSGYKAIPTSQP